MQRFVNNYVNRHKNENNILLIVRLLKFILTYSAKNNSIKSSNNIKTNTQSCYFLQLHHKENFSIMLYIIIVHCDRKFSYVVRKYFVIAFITFL